MIDRITTIVAAIGAFLAALFYALLQRKKAEQAKDRADAADASVDARQEADEALRETAERQREEREPPDTDKRNDFGDQY